MHAYNGDWDVIYPFSAVRISSVLLLTCSHVSLQFLSPYEIALDPYVSSYADGRFAVKATNDTVDLEAGTRSLTLLVRHPGLIWTSGFYFSSRPV